MRLSVKFTSWLRLIRAPNLFTVPGDTLAGFALVAFSAQPIELIPLCWAIGASLCLYVAGMLGNDWADFYTDARERPNRPLPAGLIPRSHALYAAIYLTLLGLTFSLFVSLSAIGIALYLTAMIWAYTLKLKQYAWPGCATLGMCRAFNLLLGTAACTTKNVSALWIPLTAAGVMFLYVFGLSWIARTETTPSRVTRVLWAPSVVCLGAAVWLWWADNLGWIAGGLMLAAAVHAGIAPYRARHFSSMKPDAIQQMVGHWIRCLILMQSALCAYWWPEGCVWIAGLLAAFMGHRVWSNKFYAS